MTDEVKFLGSKILFMSSSVQLSLFLLCSEFFYIFFCVTSLHFSTWTLEQTRVSSTSLFPFLRIPLSCPPLVARQRPEESETPRRAAVSVTMATVWVIQVEVRENKLFSVSTSTPQFLFSSLSLLPPFMASFHFLSLCADCLPFFSPLLLLSSSSPPSFLCDANHREN